MSIGRDVVQRGFMLGRKNDHTKPYLLWLVVVNVLSNQYMKALSRRILYSIFLFRNLNMVPD